MEWAIETVKDAASAVIGTAGETAEVAYETAAEYVPATGGKESPSLTASIINTSPFSSFKPDPANVWRGYLIYLLLAAACTLPWWTFIVAADYFLRLYPHAHILRLIPLVYFGPWLVVYALFSAFGRQYTSWARINIGLVISILAVLVIPVMDGFFIHKGHGNTVTFWVTLGAVGLAGVGDSIAQGSLLGIASELPERFTHAYVTGASVSGILVFIIRVITKAAISNLRTSAIVYFSIAPVFIILVLSLFAYVHYQPEMSYYNSLGLGSMDTVRRLLEDEASVTVEVAASAGIAAIAAGRSSPAQPIEYKPVLERVQLLIAAVALTAVVSLSIFPGFVIEDVHSRRLGSWYPVLLVGTYLVFDVLGRYLTRHTLPDRHSTLFGASCARLLLIPFFIFAVLGSSRTRTPMIFTLIALLGATNGFLIACLTILVPRVNPSDQAEPAGILMALFLTIGTLIGAGLSWLWVFIDYI